MTRATVFIAFTLVFTQLVRSQWSFSQNPHRRRQRQDFVFPGEEDNYFNPAPPPQPQSIQSNFGGQNNFGQPPQFNTNFFVQKPPPYKPAPPPFQQQQQQGFNSQQQQGFNPQQQGFQANRFSGRASEKKCNEYSELIEKKISFGTLSLGSSSTDVINSQCDISTGLIVGGIKAGPGQLPHMAAIGYPTLSRELHFGCGGSLISERFVLTAAHCKRNGRYTASIVRLGVLNLQERQSQDFGIDNFIAHEHYNTRTKQNDIAVIKLSRDVSFGNPQLIRPACLWKTEYIPTDQTVASGWGLTEYAGETSSELMKVRLDILDNNLCVKTYEDEPTLIINGNQICAGILSGGKDTCHGDSGGPIQIVLPDKKCVSHIIGITSYGGYCGGQNSPSLYTRVSAYLDWIEAKVWA